MWLVGAVTVTLFFLFRIIKRGKNLLTKLLKNQTATEVDVFAHFY